MLDALSRTNLAASRAWDRLAALPPAAILGVLFSFFIALSLWEMHDESVTNDELVHLSAGYTYLARTDYRLNTEHPILVKTLAALPLFFLDPKWPSGPDWGHVLQWQFGYHFFYTSGNDAYRLLFWGRVPMLFWSLLTIGAVYAIVHSLYGASGALLCAILAAALPMFLGHGHLVTTDVPIAGMMLLTAFAFRRLADTPTLKEAAVCGVLLAGSLLVKYSAVLLLPPLLWYLVTRWIAAARTGPRPPGAARRAVLRWTACFAVIGALSLLLIWAAYGFRYRASPEPGVELGWGFERTKDSTIGKTLTFARERRLLPEAYLHGFWYMFENAQSRNAYACGLRSPVGWWWYFAFAFLVKTPVSALLLMIAGSGRAMLRRTAGQASADVFLIPAIMYWVISSAGNIMIGLRHMMPVFPMMIVMAGGLLAGEPRPGRKSAALALVALLLVEVLAAGPYYLAYFNGPSVAAAPRHWMLTDSNLDWGQDLGRLKKWMDRNGVPKLKLAYFGNDSPRHRGLNHDRLKAANMYQQYEPEWMLSERIEGGDWIAVAATNYSGVVMGEDYDYYRLRLDDLKPTATIGHSILIYHLPPRWTPPPGVPR